MQICPQGENYIYRKYLSDRSVSPIGLFFVNEFVTTEIALVPKFGEQLHSPINIRDELDRLTERKSGYRFRQIYLSIYFWWTWQTAVLFNLVWLMV
jgi:hypothetical protein